MAHEKRLTGIYTAFLWLEHESDSCLQCSCKCYGNLLHLPWIVYMSHDWLQRWNKLIVYMSHDWLHRWNKLIVYMSHDWLHRWNKLIVYMSHDWLHRWNKLIVYMSHDWLHRWNKLIVYMSHDWLHRWNKLIVYMSHDWLHRWNKLIVYMSHDWLHRWNKLIPCSFNRPTLVLEWMCRLYKSASVSRQLVVMSAPIRCFCSATEKEKSPSPTSSIVSRLSPLILLQKHIYCIDKSCYRFIT